MFTRLFLRKERELSLRSLRDSLHSRGVTVLLNVKAWHMGIDVSEVYIEVPT